MGIKTSAEDAGWSLREAAWDVEEQLLWRGSDKARAAATRALDAVEPLQRIVQTKLTWPSQRLVQTKLTWPVGDAARRSGTAARSAVATVAVVAVAGAGAAGVLALGDSGADGRGVEAQVASASFGTSSAQTLSGAPVDFKRTSNTTDPGSETTVAAQAVPPTGKAAPDPAAPPANVAWDFAQAFVAYEVGKADEETVATFAEVADAPLAEALGTDPPRLPADQKVPEAKVLNVVVGERKDDELEVSVSMVRLQAASELRLTLRHTPKGWRVAKVLG